MKILTLAIHGNGTVTLVSVLGKRRGWIRGQLKTGVDGGDGWLWRGERQ